MKALLLLMALISFTTLHCNCVTKQLKIGDLAPDFELMNQDGQMVKLSDLKGKKVALYFYPKDSTPGCTQQACSLRDGFAPLHDAGIIIFGISKGSLKSKHKFIKKQGLNFPLLIATEDVLDAYGVSTGFWRLYIPKRHTFLVDENGMIVGIIEHVDTKHHAQQILDEFAAIK
jgi:thioredoxin-dependent peroxiredoxin